MRVRCRLSMVIRLSISSILYGRDMSRCLTAGCFAWSEKISCSHGSCNCKSLQQASSQMGIPVIPMIFRNFHSYYSIYPTLFQVGLVEAPWSKANLRCCRGSTKPCMNCGVEIRLVFCICFLRSNCLNLLGTLGVDRTTQTSTSCLASSPRDPKWQTKALVKVAPTAADKGPMKQLPLWGTGADSGGRWNICPSWNFYPKGGWSLCQRDHVGLTNMNTNVQILDNYNDNVRYCFVIFFLKNGGTKKNLANGRS